VPTAVLIIHSFSATDPNDPQTIAGRWLANGAFIYFGAMHEPFLQSFRPPMQVAGMIAEGLPLGAANRRSPPEPFGQPWRLVYLGDPLFRLQPRDRRAPRLDRWEPLDSWPAYGEYQQPAADAPEATRLYWALKIALFQLQGSVRPQRRIDLPAVLGAIRRDRLEPRLRPVYDALLVDTLLEANSPKVLLDRLSRIPPSGRSSVVQRTLESLQMAVLQKLIDARDFTPALSLWGEVLTTEPAPAFLQAFTERVTALADTPARRGDWRLRLEAAKRRLGNRSPLSAVIAAEIGRVSQRK
jgi:hypothetical protein